MYSRNFLNEIFRDGFLLYNDIFAVRVHGVYDEKMEAVYRKSGRKGSFGENTESTYYIDLWKESLSHLS